MTVRVSRGRDYSVVVRVASRGGKKPERGKNRVSPPPLWPVRTHVPFADGAPRLTFPPRIGRIRTEADPRKQRRVPGNQRRARKVRQLFIAVLKHRPRPKQSTSCVVLDASAPTAAPVILLLSLSLRVASPLRAAFRSFFSLRREGSFPSRTFLSV